MVGFLLMLHTFFITFDHSFGDSWHHIQVHLVTVFLDNFLVKLKPYWRCNVFIVKKAVEHHCMADTIHNEPYKTNNNK